jgi:hypothetical protein
MRVYEEGSGGEWMRVYEEYLDSGGERMRVYEEWILEVNGVSIRRIVGSGGVRECEKSGFPGEGKRRVEEEAPFLKLDFDYF